MRIGICARTWGERGGIGTYTRHLTHALVRLESDDEYHVLFADRSHMGSLRDVPRAREVHLPSRSKLAWDQVAVARYADRVGLDALLHTKLSVPLLASCRTAMVVHGTERFVYPEHHRWPDLIYFRTLYRLYLQRASLVLAVSNRARDDLIEHAALAPARVAVTHLAADPTFRVIEDAEERARVRRLFSLPDRFILFVGHIYPGKNFGRLVEALHEVRQRTEIDLVVAGGLRWNYEADLARVRSLGLTPHVHFLGHVEHADLALLYNLAVTAVFPSHYESFLLCNLEAQACGCPLVTSRTGGSPEAAGEGAIYVDPLDPHDIATGLLRALTDEQLRADLMSKGFRNAARFSWERTARATRDALAGMVSPAEANPCG